MSEPVLSLEVALATDPTATTQLWTDLTPWWLLDGDWQTKFGRTSERERFPAGAGSLRLDNADRRFDPLNTAGPYADLTVTTTLTAAVTTVTATTISVASSASFPTDDFELVIGTETMLVTGGFGTTTLTVQRGYLSTAATHLSGATVTWHTPGLVPDRRVRIRATWNLLSQYTAFTSSLYGYGTWVSRLNATFGTPGDGTLQIGAYPISNGRATGQTGSGINNIPADEGGVYTATAGLKSGNATTAAVGLEFLNAAGVSISVTYGTYVATSSGVITPATVTAAAPPGTAFVAMLIDFTYLSSGSGHNGNVSGIGLYPTDTAPVAWSAGGGHDIFTGHIERWPLTWQHPSHGYVDLDMVDAIKPLNLARIDESPLEMELRAANPTRLWLLADEEGATVARPAIGLVDGQYLGLRVNGDGTPRVGGRVGGDTGVAADQRSGMGIASGGVQFPPNARPTSASWTITWIGNTPGIEGEYVFTGLKLSGEPITGAFVSSPVSSLEVNITGDPDIAFTNGINIRGVDSTGTPFNKDTALAHDYLEGPHHYAVTYEDSLKRIRVYVDGVLAAFFTTAAVLRLGGNEGSFTLGPLYSSQGTTFYALALFDGVLMSQATMLAHTAAAFAPWAGDTTGERIGRILDAAGWPTADRDIDTGNSTLGPVETLNGAIALAEMQAVEEAEGGALHVTPAGVVRFRERRAIYIDTRSTTPVAVISDDPGPGEYGMADNVQPQLDGEFVITESRVKRTAPDANEQKWTSPHRSRHFIRSAQRSLNLATDAEALSRAQWDISLYGTAQPRIDALTLRPTVDASLWPLIFTLGVGDRLRVVTTPLGSGSEVTLDGLIEGREINATKDGGWVVTYRLNTRETVPVWRWGISQWGVDTRWSL